MKSYNNYNNYNKNRINHNTGRTYVWRITWWSDRNPWKDYQRTFKSKQDALMFKSKLEFNFSNYNIHLERYYG